MLKMVPFLALFLSLLNIDAALALGGKTVKTQFKPENPYLTVRLGITCSAGKATTLFMSPAEAFKGVSLIYSINGTQSYAELSKFNGESWIDGGNRIIYQDAKSSEGFGPGGPQMVKENAKVAIRPSKKENPMDLGDVTPEAANNACVEIEQQIKKECSGSSTPEVCLKMAFEEIASTPRYVSVKIQPRGNVSADGTAIVSGCRTLWPNASGYSRIVTKYIYLNVGSSSGNFGPMDGGERHVEKCD